MLPALFLFACMPTPADLPQEIPPSRVEPIQVEEVTMQRESTAGLKDHATKPTTTRVGLLDEVKRRGFAKVAATQVGNAAMFAYLRWTGPPSNAHPVPAEASAVPEPIHHTVQREGDQR